MSDIERIKEQAAILEKMVAEAADKSTVPDAFDSEIRHICTSILDAARVDDMGGCPLCAS